MLEWHWLTNHKLDHYIAHDGLDSEGRFTLVFPIADAFHAFVRGLAESVGATLTESKITLPIPDIIAAGGIPEWPRDPLNEDRFLELFGIEETGFSDELDVCDLCQRIIAFREEANFTHGDDRFCLACVNADPDLYLEDYWAHEEPHNFILDPEDHDMGFPVRDPDGTPHRWQNGLHIGDEDTPGWIWKTIMDLNLRAVMKIDSDMFTTRWEIWGDEQSRDILQILLLQPPETFLVERSAHDDLVRVSGVGIQKPLYFSVELENDHAEEEWKAAVAEGLPVSVWTPPKRVVHPTGRIAEAMLRGAAQHMKGPLNA